MQKNYTIEHSGTRSGSRPARNQLEIDMLPPFGRAEVSMAGTVALAGGVIISTLAGLALAEN